MKKAPSAFGAHLGKIHTCPGIFAVRTQLGNERGYQILAVAFPPEVERGHRLPDFLAGRLFGVRDAAFVQGRKWPYGKAQLIDSGQALDESQVQLLLLRDSNPEAREPMSNFVRPLDGQCKRGGAASKNLRHPFDRWQIEGDAERPDQRAVSKCCAASSAHGRYLPTTVHVKRWLAPVTLVTVSEKSMPTSHTTLRNGGTVES